MMLLCNVIVGEHDGGIAEVSADNPVAPTQAVENDELKSIAGDVRDRLKKVINQH